jgi:ribosomal protein S18 acetylase RimI-like enzyme
VLRHITGDQLLVARGEGIRGFVMFSVEQGTFEQDVTRGVVENIFVKSTARNEGVGSALLSSAEDHLETRGVDTVFLNVMAANEAARRFYRRHGYEPHRVEVEKSLDRTE